MNKNLILTICIEDKNYFVNDFYKICGQYTIPLMKQYAESIKADFIIITESDCIHPQNNKFKINDYLEKYDRVLYLDSDIVVKPGSPNIFDEVPEEMFGALNYGYPEKGKELMNQFLLLSSLKEIKVNENLLINSGVMILSKIHKDLIKKPDKEILVKDGRTTFKDQLYINYLLQKNDIKVHFLEERWNFRYPYKNEKRLKKALNKNFYFIHFNSRSSMYKKNEKLLVQEFIEKINKKLLIKRKKNK
jgi:lipopolysaccharide biosynthesis glycosyltransferase